MQIGNIIYCAKIATVYNRVQSSKSCVNRLVKSKVNDVSSLMINALKLLVVINIIAIISWLLILLSSPSILKATRPTHILILSLHFYGTSIPVTEISSLNLCLILGYSCSEARLHNIKEVVLGLGNRSILS